MRGRPIRGFFAGLFLGLALDLDLALSGAVKLDNAILTILPVALIVVGVALGIWAPVGRGHKSGNTAAAPLPEPVAWPESAPVEGSTTYTPSTMQQMPPPAVPPPVPPEAPPPAPPVEAPPLEPPAESPPSILPHAG